MAKRYKDSLEPEAGFLETVLKENHVEFAIVDGGFDEKTINLDFASVAKLVADLALIVSLQYNNALAAELLPPQANDGALPTK